MNLRRTTGCLLIVVPLLLTTTISSVAAADTYAASFEAVTIGSCGVVNFATGALVLGTGSFSLGGVASAVGPAYHYLYGWEYYQTVDGTMRALGWLDLSWREEGERCRLQILIYSTSTTRAVLYTTGDFMTIMAVHAQEQSLEYVGIFRRGAQVRSIHDGGPYGRGGSLFLLPLRTFAPVTPNPADSVGLLLEVWIDNAQYHFAWVDRDTQIPISPDVSFSIPAARVFVHDVRVWTP